MAAVASPAAPAPADRYPDELVREAVARDGGRCCVCGRPCGEREAWRRSEAGPLGDTSDNFSAICLKCAVFLSREGVKPARYIMHVYNVGRLRWVFSRLLVYVVGASLLTFYLMFSVLSYFVVFVWTRPEPSSVAGTLVLVVFVLSAACYLLVAAWRFGRGIVWEARALHRALGRAAVWRSGYD